MSDPVRRESPLVQFLGAATGPGETGDAGVVLSERQFLGHLNLRGDPSDQDFLQAVEKVLGVGLPVEPNTVSEKDGLAVLWLGPNEWLIITPPDRQSEIATRLRDALSGVFAAVNDLSGGQTVINLQGKRARDVINKGCPLDLHPRVFGPGRCAQSHIAKSMATIRQVDDSPSFDIIVRRSFADYLARWLTDAGREYGLAILPPPRT